MLLSYCQEKYNYSYIFIVYVIVIHYSIYLHGRYMRCQATLKTYLIKSLMLRNDIM